MPSSPVDHPIAVDERSLEIQQAATKRLADADDRQNLLADELHHRIQNTLAIVLALARLTAMSVADIEEFQVVFGERVLAMARTNALLLRGHVQAVSVRAALEAELAPYADAASQITLDCEDLCVSADSALSLSLIIHELATNAAKYGSLSDADGRLVIRCRHDGQGGVLHWEEVFKGETRLDKIAGGGTLLIERLSRALGGTAHIELLALGLKATITFELGKAGPSD